MQVGFENGSLLNSIWSNGRAQFSEKLPRLLHLFGTVLNSKTKKDPLDREENKACLCLEEKWTFSAPSFRKAHWQFFNSQQHEETGISTC